MEASKLKEILEQHKLWLETNGVQGERANLINADLEGAELTHANLPHADLRDANLIGANLNCANLSYADLINANLWGADLINANLWGANLYCANLRDAKLNGANLYNADLRGAILRDANLEDVSFINANLTGANLTGANLTITHFENASLDSIIGLPDVSWIIPGCLVRLYKFRQHFFVTKENKKRNLNFVQDSLGFFIQDNREENTFDMLVEDRIIRGIPHWVKYSGLKQIASESV